MNCCGGTIPGNRAGEWHFPNMTSVGRMDSNTKAGRTSYFFRNRGNQAVRLVRVGAPSERGLFYCQVPNASNIVQTIYVNIGKRSYVDIINTSFSIIIMPAW